MLATRSWLPSSTLQASQEDQVQRVEHASLWIERLDPRDLRDQLDLTLVVRPWGQLREQLARACDLLRGGSTRVPVNHGRSPIPGRSPR